MAGRLSDVVSAETLNAIAGLHAPIRDYLRAVYGAESWDATGEGDPLFYDVLKAEFGIGRAEARGLTLRQVAGLFGFAHRCRTATGDDARARILAEVSELVDGLARLPDLDESGRSVLKALRYKFSPLPPAAGAP